MNRKRRQLLQGGLAASTLFLPRPWAPVWAQSEGAMKLLRAPKIALVLGNGAYKGLAVLRNPTNDAAAMDVALKAAGFEVTTKINAGREETLASIQAYARALASSQCVGLFYFAGHGIQLA